MTLREILNTGIRWTPFQDDAFSVLRLSIEGLLCRKGCILA